MSVSTSPIPSRQLREVLTESSWVRTSKACLQYSALWIWSSFSSVTWLTVACWVTETTLMMSTVVESAPDRDFFARLLTLTVVGRDQFILSMVGLTSLDGLLSINSTLGQFIRPVHPVHASVDVVLIARAYLQNPGNPVIVTLSPWAELLFVGEGFLALDGVLVGDKDVVVTEVLRPVD